MNPANQIIGGTIKPPIDTLPDDPQAALAKIIGTGIQIFIFVAGIFLLIYLLWGAFDWIVSSGEKERITKAQNKITNAILGMLLIVVLIVIYGVITQDILGIITKTPTGWQLNIPTF
jgi:magnesium-transporting ATPase (P-type)